MPQEELVLLDPDPGLLSMFHFCKSERTWFQTIYKTWPQTACRQVSSENKQLLESQISLISFSVSVLLASSFFFFKQNILTFKIETLPWRSSG